MKGRSSGGFTPADFNRRMSYFRHYVDVDGYGDTCLFRVYDGNEDNPLPILRLIDLPETARFLWPTIVEGMGA